MNKILVLIIILLLFIILIKYNDHKEHADTVEPQILTNETIQTLASVYNKNNMIVTNLKVTGNLAVDNNLTGATNYVPIGTIVAWYNQNADLSKIPEGWKICDGNNGTPDLRGRFILGQGLGMNLTQRKMSDRGGDETVKLTVEQMPKHSHKYTSGDSGNKSNRDFYYGAGEGAHLSNENEINTTEAGKDQPHNNMPPFYVLAYIMRVS